MSVNVAVTRFIRGLAIFGLAACVACSGGAKVQSDGSVHVDGNDRLRFVPDHLTVTAGKHRFAFSNVGQLQHEFRIVGVYTTGTISGGHSASFEATVQAGTYQFVCRTDNHDKSGMVGTLVVK